jgi:hypothetical protein
VVERLTRKTDCEDKVHNFVLSKTQKHCVRSGIDKDILLTLSYRHMYNFNGIIVIKKRKENKINFETIIKLLI